MRLGTFIIGIFASFMLWQSCGDPPPETSLSPCEEHSDYLFCQNKNAECGELTSTDACGQTRTVDCGQCDSRCLENNRCECIPEDDQLFCSRNLQSCAFYDGIDNCGVPRSVDCGTCEDGELCLQNLSAMICRPDSCNATNCRDGTCVNGSCKRNNGSKCPPYQGWNGSQCVPRQIDRP